jgi:DNA-binding IclR family transcriptional regulator
VRDYTGTVIGAISTSMPSSRFLMFDEVQLSKRVKAAACVVSKALGSYPH